MKIYINGAKHRCKTASVSIKHLFGKHAVLVKNSPKSTNPKGLPGIAPPCMEGGDTQISSNGSFDKLVICAVDARGHFAVEPEGSYSIFAYSTTVEDIEQPASQHANKAKKKRKDLDDLNYQNSSLEDIFKYSSSEVSSKCIGMNRGSNKYNQFVGLFRGAFANTSFRDAAMEWGYLSKEEKENIPVEQLVERIHQQGKYQLLKSEN